MIEDKRIRINPAIAEMFYNSSFYRQNSNIVSLTQVCNDLLENFLLGKVVLLSDVNKQSIESCATALGKDNNFVINALLNKIELIPEVNPPKTKVEIVNHQDIKINKTRMNKIKNW